MRLNVGDIEVQSVVEYQDGFRSPAQIFKEATDEAMAEFRPLLEPWALDPATGLMIFNFQSYLVRTPNHTVLIDTCIGCGKTMPRMAEWHQREDDTWLRNLRSAGVQPEEIDYVFCTHLHVDHCGWNTQLKDGRWTPTFPNAKYVFARPEYEASERGGSDTYKENVLPIMEAGQALLVDVDHAVDDHLWLQPTPGHTPGHVAVSLASNGAHASMCGDLIHTPLQCLLPEWSPVFDSDKEQARQTRRAYLEERCEAGDLMLTAHFPSPSAGKVVPRGDAFWIDFVDQN
jgi:glyoxylase-like metal-dependent hydrolase (beta-lactamase superfamily II)